MVIEWVEVVVVSDGGGRRNGNKIKEDNSFNIHSVGCTNPSLLYIMCNVKL